MHVLAIDPGNTESGYALIDSATCRVVEAGKIGNEELLMRLWEPRDPLAHSANKTVIEMVASYGMAVGETVFDTCVWIGRFYEAVEARGRDVTRMKRLVVKLHHCHDSKAKDSNIIQALVDRFASGQPNRGKGTKAAPGWFYGFAADVWQAYALAVVVADLEENRVAA